MNPVKQKILVVGLGLSGQSLVKFYQKQGYDVLGYDEGNIHYSEIKIYRNLSEIQLKNFVSIAYSPGISLDHPLLVQAKVLKIPCLCEIEVGVSLLQGYTIGVTGTNGKSTVTLLIAHVLNTCGIAALALGNIGVPLTQKVGELNQEKVILELSSYQLDSLKESFLDQAILLNISPDHLDRYKNYQAYIDSKLSIQKRLKTAGFLITHSKYKPHFSHQKESNLVLYYDEVKDAELSAFLSKKNKIQQLNFSAAFCSLISFGLSTDQIIAAFKTYSGLAHRLEWIKTLNQVTFVNDSKATNLDAVAQAVTSFSKPLRLIMGGKDKGLDFSPLLPYFKDKVKKIYAIGEAKEKLSKQLGSEIELSSYVSLKDAMIYAYKEAKQGEVVLLSPGCSSFDAYKNFEDRGEEFRRLVDQIEGDIS